MGYTYTPTYYRSSLHDSLTSICKSILPISFKKKRLPAIAAAEQQLAKQQSDNLKWQQESFHQILKLMGLCKEDIIHEDEVSVFKTHLLETVIAAPIDHEAAVILRDKLIFLQELLYAKCISDEEYHSSKRPLLQRLGAQGAEIGARDVIAAASQKEKKIQTEEEEEEWSSINLKQEKCLFDSRISSMCKNKYGEEFSPMKKIKGCPSVNGSNWSKSNNIKSSDDVNALTCSAENPFWNDHITKNGCESKSILMVESSPPAPDINKQSTSEKGKRKPFMALFKREPKDIQIVAKKKENSEYSPMELLCLDKAYGNDIKKEISRTQNELSNKLPHAQLLYDHNKDISASAPSEKSGMKCTIENSKSWATFDDEEENSHPNIFAPSDTKKHYIEEEFKYNPFFKV